MEKKRGTKAKWIILIVLMILLAFVALIGFITDFLWFKELSYVSVFFTQLFTRLKIGIPTFIVVTLLLYLYMQLLKKGYYKKIESNETPKAGRLRAAEWGIAGAGAFFVAWAVNSNLWWQALQFFHSTDFNIKDPLFGHDVSFYVFKLDFIQRLNEMIIGAVIVFVAVTVLYYAVLLSMRSPRMFTEEVEDEEPYYGAETDGGAGGSQTGSPFDELFGNFRNAYGGRQRRPRKKFDNQNFQQFIGIARTQIAILGVIFFLMLALHFFLRQYDLLYSSTGILYGAGYTDVNITRWVYRLLTVLSIAGAGFFVAGVRKGSMKTVLTVPLIMVIVGLVGSGAAALVQNFVVSPDEINKESAYLERNIAFTQMAYDLNNVDIKEFSAANNLTLDDIENNMETINNIRINDYEPTEKFYNQTQAIRQYYTFTDADVDRYMINGEYTQVFLSAREIDETKISQEWLNKHLKYTHGYGVTLSRVDKVTSSGQPDMMIDSIPPVSQIEEISIDRPEIYFGELTNNYILVNTNEKEFDYPDGSSNMYATYEGDAGIKLNMLNRMMFSIRERSMKLLVSTNINSDSRIVINRNIAERVNQIMPYLSYDSDPYIVTADGRLYWIIDAYTVSDKYPYSEPFSDQSRVNYIRNSVKVVIDAYNGTTNYYLVDDSDPIANTMKKIYPDLFKNFDEMPESLQAHIRYPNMLFQIQANIYARYHMEDVNVFYQGEDLWDISNEIYGTAEQPMTPNYYIMKLPGEAEEEFVNTIPYTPRDKDNMMALLVARNDGEHYGELVLYQLPKSRVIYGPMQIEAQIDQNTEISKEFSLWNSSGSTYTRGNMFVIPIEDSLIYVEPVYLEASNSAIPEVKRVIVAYNDRIAYEETLADALTSLFGEREEQPGQGGTGDTPDTNDPGALTTTELITLANEAFDNAQAAQQSGNWAQYGEYLTQLENYLTLLAGR